MKPCNLYLNYKITNKLIRKIINNDYNGKWDLKLSPKHYVLNRTNNNDCKNIIELVELQCMSIFTFEELDLIRIEIIRNLNTISKCIESHNYKETAKLELIVKQCPKKVNLLIHLHHQN